MGQDKDMPKVEEKYKCNICGNLVEIIEAGYGTLVCCGEPMDLLEEEEE